MYFNTINFLNNVKKMHLKSRDELLAFEAVPYTSVRSTLSDIPLQGFTDDDKSLVSKALDDICNNVVGKTMFMLLVSKKDPCELKIINIGPREAKNRLIDQEGSSYYNYDVQVNLNVYNRNGVGIPDRQYYCVHESGNVALKLKSLSASIFHEFTHCLHEVENWRRYGRDCLSSTSDLWTDEEERRTIAGYINPGVFDPICDNCFHLYDSIVNKKAYFPRIGHWDYRSNDFDKDEKNRTKLSSYLLTLESKEIIENWNKYVIE